ncbi:hypothetical protein [Clostridium tyrobutyricum]|uniref:hypothetical protein n=1 Tax=Clostridium tyrobutyricum TaxID=1519 RepID=UPI00189D682B|nr:hypothetical protein [Clostridium tyrobutyricum]
MSNDYKSKAVENLYKGRHSQLDVANKLNMSIGDVARITKALGFCHGVRDLIPLFVHLNQLKVLDKYPSENFRPYI